MKLKELNIPLQTPQDQHKMFDEDSYCPECGEAVVDNECTDCDYVGPGGYAPLGSGTPQGGL